MRKDGAVVVWTQSDPEVLPPQFAAIAPNAEVGAPFDLPMRRGDGAVHVGWAIREAAIKLAIQNCSAGGSSCGGLSP